MTERCDRMSRDQMRLALIQRLFHLIQVAHSTLNEQTVPDSAVASERNVRVETIANHHRSLRIQRRKLDSHAFEKQRFRFAHHYRFLRSRGFNRFNKSSGSRHLKVTERSRQSGVCNINRMCCMND
jgi:hypothetical protein